jgi:sigma-E factor negative regulatory protein RseC
MICEMNANSSLCFEQKGIVESTSFDCITVKLNRESACGQCGSQGICHLYGPSERTIVIDKCKGHFSPGDDVRVTITPRMGNKAVLFGYLFPFLLLIVVLLVLTSLSVKELLSGLLSLAALVPYYCILYLFREKLKREFIFQIRKTEVI